MKTFRQWSYVARGLGICSGSGVVPGHGIVAGCSSSVPSIVRAPVWSTSIPSRTRCGFLRACRQCFRPDVLQTLFPVADLAAVADLVADRRRVGLWPFLSCCGPCFRVCMAVLALFGRFWARVVSLYGFPPLLSVFALYGHSRTVPRVWCIPV